MEKIRSYARSLPINFESWIATFVGIVLVRIFFEQFSSFEPRRYILIDTPMIIHYGVFYLATIVLLMVLLLIFAKANIQEVFIISIFGLCAIWIAPIIDLLSAGVGGHVMTYLFASGKEMWIRFITYFGGYVDSGATLGIQIEVTLIMAFCFFYVYKITKSIYRAIGMIIAFYIVIFFLFSIPSIITLFLLEQSNPAFPIFQSIGNSYIIQNNIHPEFTATKLGLFDLGFDKMMIGIHTIVAFFALVLFFFIGVRKKFIAIVKNSRPERIFYYLLLFTWGAALAHQATWFKNWIDIQSYILSLIAFTCAWLFSVCQNDIQDEKIDSVSNKNRPLISKELSVHDMSVAYKIFFLFALLSSYAASSYVFFFVCLFMFISYIYSNPPLRLRRFVIVSSFLIGLASLVTILAGFFLLNPDKSIVAFQFNLALGFVILFTAVANIRDIKDIEGDREDGVTTLPVLMGAKRAKILISGIVCFFMLLIPWYLKIPFMIIPSIIASIFSLYFINKKNYKDWKVFVIFITYLILIIGSITFI